MLIEMSTFVLAWLRDCSLVITHQFTKRGESGLLDEGTLQILRCAQDDKV